MAFSPDFRTLTSAGADHTVRLWSVVTRRQLPVLAGHTDYANDVAATGPGRRPRCTWCRRPLPAGRSRVHRMALPRRVVLDEFLGTAQQGLSYGLR
ncbi:hypothetical protein [Streptomyces sp. SAI-117]|uniref:WD40 repeat domain-containing protein n=1 Tax=Streptomyces sp. SAI-117 TaxID=2940546 RepID=UPI0032AED769